MPRNVPKILVADDEPGIREFVVAVLEEGYEVVAVPNGTEALRVLQQEPDFDLLFTDIIMPDRNGLEVAAEAKKLCPGIRVLYGTGFVESLGLASTKLHGPLIQKPYRADTLSLHIQEALAV